VGDDSGPTAVHDAEQPGSSGGGGVVISDASPTTVDVATPSDVVVTVPERDAAVPRDADAVADVVTEGRAGAGFDAQGPGPEAAPAEAGCSGGYAIQLAGATSASITRVIQDDFTIEAWIKVSSSLTGTYFWQGSAILWADVASKGNDFLMSLLNDKLTFGVGNPDTAAQSTTDVVTGKWHHVAATRTKASGVMTVFVNGVAQASATGNVSSLNATATMLIGNSTDGDNGFVGQLDELRIWKTVRSAAQISANMTRRLVGNESGLVSYFRFDESSGPTALDSSPSLNHALFKGPVTWVPSTAPICN